MTKRRELKRGRDVRKVLDKHDCRWRQGKGSHMVGYLPDGNVITFYDGKLSTGVRCKLRKALRAAGLLLLLVVPAVVGALLALAV